MKIEDRIYADLSTDVILAIALHPDWNLDKAHAIYELALRAIVDKSLLSVAWQCVGDNILVSTHQGTPLGRFGAVALLDSDNPEVESSLIHSLDTWSREQQSDFFVAMYHRNIRRLVIERFKREYGFIPKFDISELGDIRYD